MVFVVIVVVCFEKRDRAIYLLGHSALSWQQQQVLGQPVRSLNPVQVSPVDHRDAGTWDIICFLLD